MIRNWLSVGGRVARPRSPGRRSVRPQVEALESRELLSASLGTFDPGSATWYLRREVSAGAPDGGTVNYGMPGGQPVAGDWNGDGTATIGVVDPATMTWYLKDTNAPGTPDVAPFRYGAPGWVPVVGDWNGDGAATVGVFDPVTATWYLRNSNSSGAPDVTPFAYGASGWVPVVGDWDGDGATTVGIFDPVTATWYLRNSNTLGAPAIAPFAYGGAAWRPAAGDWDGDGVTTIGAVSRDGTWYPRNVNGPGPPDITPFAYGSGAWTPLTLSNWNPRSAAQPPLTGTPPPTQTPSPTPVGRPSQTLDRPASIVYIPSGIEASKTYPIVFAFDPGANAQGLIDSWKPTAESKKWIIDASKLYRNGLAIEYIQNTLRPAVRAEMLSVVQAAPADVHRILYTGVSGGASFSHSMNIAYPGWADALIVNVGRVWGEDVDSGPNIGTVLPQSQWSFDAAQLITLTPAAFSASRKLIVFLASPTDFRYRAMQQDATTYAQLGWKVKWIEFAGGHAPAPPEAYGEAFTWLHTQGI